MSWLSILASENLHWDSTQRIFHAPMSVFDTTVRIHCESIGQCLITVQPLGRMLSVLGKDIDVLGMLTIVHTFLILIFVNHIAVDNQLSGKRENIIVTSPPLLTVLSEALRMFVVIISGVLGSVVVIAIIEHYFLIAVAFIVVGYLYFAAFYRSSARELKRLGEFFVIYQGHTTKISQMPIFGPCCIPISPSHFQGLLP